MGDLANMTDSDGRVSGPRLLRWLRSRAQMEHESAERYIRMDNDFGADVSIARRNLLMDMADDLERELTPPDYPEDNGAEPPSDGKDTGPCEHCGRLANRVPVHDNGRVFLGCPGCAARASGDGVDLDDPCLTVDPDERNQS